MKKLFKRLWSKFLEKEVKSVEQYEYQVLEILIDKLASKLGGRIMITNGHLQDGFHIGLYSHKTGELIDQAAGPYIYSCVDKLINGTKYKKEGK